METREMNANKMATEFILSYLGSISLGDVAALRRSVKGEGADRDEITMNQLRTVILTIIRTSQMTF